MNLETELAVAVEKLLDRIDFLEGQLHKATGTVPRSARLSDAIASTLRKAHGAQPVAKDGKPRQTMTEKRSGNILPGTPTLAEITAPKPDRLAKARAKLDGETRIQRMSRIYRETGVHPQDQPKDGS